MGGQFAPRFYGQIHRDYQDEKEKLNNELKEDANRAIMLSSLLFLSSKAIEKFIESFASIHKNHLENIESFPNRQIVILKVSIERLLKLPNLESYLNTFNKVYQNSKVRIDNEVEISLFNEVIMSLDWAIKFEELFEKDYNYNYERFNKLYEEIYFSKMNITEQLVQIQNDYKSNPEIYDDLGSSLSYNDNIQTLEELINILFKEKILKSKFINLISKEDRIALVKNVLDAERNYLKMVRLNKGMFSQLPHVIKDLESVKVELDKVVLELNKSINDYKKPVLGGFFYKLFRYPFK